MTELRPTLKQWLAAGPFTLAMSSGFFGFYAHAGVLAALDEAGLAPAGTRGSSAGALITGLWAAGLAPERLADELLRLQRADFWDPRPGLGLLRGKLFDAKLRQLLPVQDFAACRVPVRISVFDVLTRRTELRTSGDLAAAIRASCALPGMFQPVWIDRRPKLDGGIADRPGLHLAPAGERILYHHLTSTSPWRRFHGKAEGLPPPRTNLATLVIGDLPRVTPLGLRVGRDAFAKARAGATAALNRPVNSPEGR